MITRSKSVAGKGESKRRLKRMRVEEEEDSWGNPEIKMIEIRNETETEEDY